MSTQKAKFELYSRLQALGFTYEEAVALRRIEMTLRRWAEQECGDSNDYASWCITRDEKTGKPYIERHTYAVRRLSGGTSRYPRYPIADREAGALKRLKAIVDARNLRATTDNEADNFVIPYHQTDPRGCALYLVKRSDLEAKTNQVVEKAEQNGFSRCRSIDGPRVTGPKDYVTDTFPGIKFDTPETAARRFLKEKNLSIPNREMLPVDQYYTRGLAVCC